MKMVILRHILLMIIGLWSFHAQTTSFIPVPFDTQIKESNAIIFAHYQGKSFKKLANGEVVTVASFKIARSLGLDYNDLLNKNSFSIYYPGGEWQGITYFVHGSPNFYTGEEVALFLKQHNHGYILQNLSMGKYKIVEDSDGSKVLVSSVFPQHEYGKISVRKFQKLAQNLYGEEFRETNDENEIVIHKGDRGLSKKENNRTIASTEEAEDSSSEPKESYSMSWLIFIMIFLAVIFLKLNRRES